MTYRIVWAATAVGGSGGGVVGQGRESQAHSIGRSCVCSASGASGVKERGPDVSRRSCGQDGRTRRCTVEGSRRCRADAGLMAEKLGMGV